MRPNQMSLKRAMAMGNQISKYSQPAYVSEKDVLNRQQRRQIAKAKRRDPKEPK